MSRALKLLDAARPEALQRELDRLSLIRDHRASVVTVHERGAHAKRPWFVMDLLHGETLEQRAKRAPMRLDEAVRIFADVARVLDEAHANELVHRDIKPSNVFPSDERLDPSACEQTSPARRSSALTSERTLKLAFVRAMWS